jgi:hypothetical protein
MAELCCCCTEILTIKNVVNGKCGHQLCKDCFWKWTTENNTCPFCRDEFFKNTQHADYIQLGKDMNTRREIIEELEEEKEFIKRRILRLSSKCIAKTRILKTFRDEIKIISEKEDNIVKFIADNIEFVDQVKMWKTDPHKAFKLWDKEQKQLFHKNRTHVIKKLRVVLDEMGAGYLDRKNRYITEDMENEYIKLENSRSSKRRRLNTGMYFIVRNHFMTPFVRASNIRSYVRAKQYCFPIEPNYCIRGLFQNRTNPVISGLDYNSYKKCTASLDHVDIFMQDHFKYQLQ